MSIRVNSGAFVIFYKIMQNEFLLLGIYSQLIKMCSNIIKILKKLLSKKAVDYNSISIFISIIVSLQQVYTINTYLFNYSLFQLMNLPISIYNQMFD